jgi:hypothetical protein
MSLFFNLGYSFIVASTLCMHILQQNAICGHERVVRVLKQIRIPYTGSFFFLTRVWALQSMRLDQPVYSNNVSSMASSSALKELSEQMYMEQILAVPWNILQIGTEWGRQWMCVKKAEWINTEKHYLG